MPTIEKTDAARAAAARRKAIADAGPRLEEIAETQSGGLPELNTRVEDLARVVADLRLELARRGLIEI